MAFSVRLTLGKTPSMSPNQDIVFNDVLLNVGSAYHSGHGIFVAPVPGVYFFTMSLLALGTTPHHAKLVNDGRKLARADFNDPDHFDDSSLKKETLLQFKMQITVACYMQAPIIPHFLGFCCTNMKMFHQLLENKPFK